MRTKNKLPELKTEMKYTEPSHTIFTSKWSMHRVFISFFELVFRHSYAIKFLHMHMLVLLNCRRRRVNRTHLQLAQIDCMFIHK